METYGQSAKNTRVSITITITPVAPRGTSVRESFRRAQSLADDIAKIPGIENANCSNEPLEKVAGAPDAMPIIITAISGAALVASTTLPALINNLFELFKDKRNKTDQAATVVKIQKNYFRIDGTADERLKQDILKLIGEISKKDTWKL